MRREAQRGAFEICDLQKHLCRLGIDAYLDVTEIETGPFGVVIDVVGRPCERGVSRCNTDDASRCVSRQGKVDGNGQRARCELRAVERDDKIPKHGATMSRRKPPHITCVRDPSVPHVHA